MKSSNDLALRIGIAVGARRDVEPRDLELRVVMIEGAILLHEQDDVIDGELAAGRLLDGERGGGAGACRIGAGRAPGLGLGRQRPR